jgi:hypothetical protein
MGHADYRGGLPAPAGPILPFPGAGGPMIGPEDSTADLLSKAGAAVPLSVSRAEGITALRA